MLLFLFGLGTFIACCIPFRLSCKRLHWISKIVVAVISFPLVGSVINFANASALQSSKGDANNFHITLKKLVLLMIDAFNLNHGNAAYGLASYGLIFFLAIFLILLPMWLLTDTILLVQEYSLKQDIPKSLMIELFSILTGLIGFTQFLAS